MLHPKTIVPPYGIFVTCAKTTKIDDEKINLSLNPKHETKELRQKHKG
jgi:hypothetical protein